MTGWPRLFLCFVTAGLCQAPALAQDLPVAPATALPERQPLDQAWWTGPMLANSAGALPRGHALIETYVFDRITATSHGFGSLTYMLYGVTDTLTMGVKPSFGFNAIKQGRNGSGVAMGDLTLSAQYRLASFDAERSTPAVALSVQYSLPTGKHDRLGDRPADGLGSGAHTTTVSVYAQQYFWLPNGRIFRARLNASTAFSDHATLTDVSVYGTRDGFRGRARPGQSFSLGVSGEYSLTRSWVLALDLIYSHDNPTRVQGFDIRDVGNPVRYRSGASDGFAIAPAIEYSWKPNLGVLLGTRFVPKGHNVTASITPAVAINYVY
ncbi:transporter [Sphingomonas alpina]|uniref:Transporter n=1 Tax=Sphingomonas alpina TaxID=653931 RepID=A0A7H0LJV3_9SPHN|nr:transporter [Sphingomonas alpina]QNQ09956.1 transporter [Sphingomonas alpina]